MTIKMTINGEKVRTLCIKQEWYTMGDTSEYNNLLNNLCGGFYEGKEVNEKDIEVIATDIYDHSDIDREVKIYGATEKEIYDNMVYLILNECITLKAI